MHFKQKKTVNRSNWLSFMDMLPYTNIFTHLVAHRIVCDKVIKKKNRESSKLINFFWNCFIHQRAVNLLYWYKKNMGEWNVCICINSDVYLLSIHYMLSDFDILLTKWHVISKSAKLIVLSLSPFHSSPSFPSDYGVHKIAQTLSVEL